MTGGIRPNLRVAQHTLVVEFPNTEEYHTEFRGKERSIGFLPLRTGTGERICSVRIYDKATERELRGNEREFAIAELPPWVRETWSDYF